MEIERKFLTIGREWSTSPSLPFCQGYLSRDPARTVRVRLAGEKAFLTIKGLTAGISRPEFEYAIPVADARALLPLCAGPLVEKTRYLVPFASHHWEVDEFHGANQGLVIAEIELQSEDEPFARPPWLGAEVSHDPRYYNSNLSENPFTTWPPLSGDSH